MLTNHELIELTEFRRDLHRYPEVSGEEAQTAARIAAALQLMPTSKIITRLGGHGVAAIFDSGVEGPTVMFRAELDGLRIQEQNEIAWASRTAGKSLSFSVEAVLKRFSRDGRLQVDADRPAECFADKSLRRFDNALAQR